MPKTTINYSDKLLLLTVMDYLIADVSASDRWNTPGISTDRTLMQLRLTHQQFESETTKFSSEFLNNIFVAIEFYRPVATTAQKKQLTLIQGVFLSLPKIHELLPTASLPDRNSTRFEILIDAD